MPSVIATWEGSCPDEELQKELTSYLHVLAQRSEFRLLSSTQYRAILREIRKQNDIDDQFVNPDIRVYDNELSGRIIIDSNIVKQTEMEVFLHEAVRSGIAIEELIKDPPDAEIDQLLSDLFNLSDKDSEEKQHACGSVLLLNDIKVRGIDFRLFDPRDTLSTRKSNKLCLFGVRKSPILEWQSG